MSQDNKRSSKITKVYTLDELLRSRKEGNKQHTDDCVKRGKKMHMEAIAGRSGILPIHQGCTFHNFKAGTPAKDKALGFSKWFTEKFSHNAGQSFIFSGDTGTGKNHLSAAICNQLMSEGKTCLVITITELMIRMRTCYGDNATMDEDKFIKSLISLNLLIIDEIGLQRENINEKLLINQIIDGRLGNFKPTGILTNMGRPELTELLGKRVMDRLRDNKGQWINFKWESYRG